MLSNSIFLIFKSFSDGIRGCVIGLSLVLGQLNIVLLLGYGLVEIPVSYYQHASIPKKLITF
jgi:hypothetical protein